MRSRKTAPSGFTCQELPIVIAILLMSIAIVLPAFTAVREGVRSGFTVQEIVGTAIIHLAMGFLAGLCFVLFLLTMFWFVAGLMYAWFYLKCSFQNKQMEKRS